jgi:hypothetical protein
MHIANHMSLGAVLYETGFDIDRLLWMAVDTLRERSGVVAGVIQNSAATDEGCCAPMNLVDLRTNRVFEISQALGPHARGCRLDQRGLAEAAGIIGEAITTDIDFVVINRFGKAEENGGGLLSCISDAIGASIPVLTAVREPYLDGWRKFHGGLATDLSPSENSVLTWCKTALSEKNSEYSRWSWNPLDQSGKI